VRTRCCRMGTALSRRSPSISKRRTPTPLPEHDAQVCRGVAEVACRQAGRQRHDRPRLSQAHDVRAQRVRTIHAAQQRSRARAAAGEGHAVGDVSNLGHRSDRVRPQRTRSKRWPQ
jgi:hypothetical protein